MIQPSSENAFTPGPMRHSSIEIIDSAELAKRLRCPNHGFAIESECAARIRSRMSNSAATSGLSGAARNL